MDPRKRQAEQWAAVCQAYRAAAHRYAQAVEQVAALNPPVWPAEDGTPPDWTPEQRAALAEVASATGGLLIYHGGADHHRWLYGQKPS